MKQEEFLKIAFSKHQIKAGLKVAHFNDGTSIFIYCPSLKLSAYGPTHQEAEEMFKVVLDEYFSELLSLGSTEGINELQSLGWKKDRYRTKQFKSTSYIDREGILKDFDLPLETVINEDFITA